MYATHRITWYGGEKEDVRILVDRTEAWTYGGDQMYYGTMLVESDKTDTLGNHARWVNFGLYNANRIEVLKPGIGDMPCHQGLKLPVSG